MTSLPMEHMGQYNYAYASSLDVVYGRGYWMPAQNARFGEFVLSIWQKEVKKIQCFTISHALNVFSATTQPRTLCVVIFVGTDRHADKRTRPITLPLVHACRVMICASRKFGHDQYNYNVVYHACLQRMCLGI